MQTLLSVLAGFFGILTTFLTWLKEEKLKRQGRQEAAVEAMEKVEDRVKQAAEAVAVSDPDRTKRLRQRFDRSAATSDQ